MTIHHRVEQGSGEWVRIRAGLPTASQFHKIITPKKWEFSDQSRAYAFQLASEILLNEVTESLEGIEAMEHGKATEPDAIRGFEFETQLRTAPCGFLTTDDGRIGATPDRLIIDRPSALETKCPSSAWVQLSYLIDGFGADYLPQVQGQILVGEFDFVYRYAYHKRMPAVLVRTDRDDEKQTKLLHALDQFLDLRDAIVERARASGFFAERRHLATAVDQAYADPDA